MATATDTTTTKGFTHRCPSCAEENSLRLDLADVRVMTCKECDNELGPDDIKAIIAGWNQILRWIETAPELD
jgi:uncharacterized protein (DUF983 family)